MPIIGMTLHVSVSQDCYSPALTSGSLIVFFWSRKQLWKPAKLISVLPNVFLKHVYMKEFGHVSLTTSWSHHFSFLPAVNVCKFKTAKLEINLLRSMLAFSVQLTSTGRSLFSSNRSCFLPNMNINHLCNHWSFVVNAFILTAHTHTAPPLFLCPCRQLQHINWGISTLKVQERNN